MRKTNPISSGRAIEELSGGLPDVNEDLWDTLRNASQVGPMRNPTTRAALALT
jgi:hypothetical protein